MWYRFLFLLLPLSLWLVSPPGLTAQPRLSFFCEASIEQFEALCEDSVLIHDLQVIGASIRVGTRDFSLERAEGVRKLNEAGIPVIAWLLLDERDGYWCHAGNGPEAMARYAAFRNWTDVHQLQWEGVGLDLEPSIKDIRGLYDAPTRTLWQGYLRLFDESLLPKSKASYEQLTQQIDADGYFLETYLFPPIFDERLAKTESFERLAGIIDLPTDREIPMCYTSADGVDPAMILSYGEGQAAVALGSTGGGPAFMQHRPMPSMSWEQLSRDLLLAQQVTDEIHLYSLEGCVEQGMIYKLKYFNWQQEVSLYSSELKEVQATRRQVGWALKAMAYPIASSVVILLLVGVAVWLIGVFVSWPFRAARNRRTERRG